MAQSALETFIDTTRAAWGPLTTELVERCSGAMERLAGTPPREPWLAALGEAASPSTELHRDPDHGFMLLAHTEHAGLYRPPHDHGASWVIYAVLAGEIEMRTYGRIEDAAGRVRLVRRGATVLRPGRAEVYLPGDIHDTRCLSASALLLRFTERDLKLETRLEDRVTRYVEHDGVWTTPAP
ncbi:MAG: hypothetical protein JSR45_17970 [Proteobacteria bacterium]|nr:hypothetical protein [Pseudomonadota bacterium]